MKQLFDSFFCLFLLFWLWDWARKVEPEGGPRPESVGAEGCLLLKRFEILLTCFPPPPPLFGPITVKIPRDEWQSRSLPASTDCGASSHCRHRFLRSFSKPDFSFPQCFIDFTPPGDTNKWTNQTEIDFVSLSFYFFIFFKELLCINWRTDLSK